MRQCCPACTSTQSPDPFFRCGWLFTFPVTDFQAIPAGILKEDGIVARFLVERTLNIPRACAYDKRGQALDLAQTVGPKRETTFIGGMLWRLRHSHKLRLAIRSFGLVLQPSFDCDLACEPQRGQERLIKRPRLRKAAYSEIYVIETPSHHWSRHSD